MAIDKIMAFADEYATRKLGEGTAKARAALLKAVEALVADAERYRWLREHKAMWSWNPAHYKEGLISGFAHANTGYLGFDFESALKDAMKKETP